MMNKHTTTFRFRPNGIKSLLLMLLLLVMGVGEIFAQSAGDVVMFNNVGKSETSMMAYPTDPTLLPGSNDTYPCKVYTTNTADLYQYWEIEDARNGNFYIKNIGRMANGNKKCYLVQYKYENTDANKDIWSTTFAAASDLATLGDRAKFTLTPTGDSDGSVYIHVISQADDNKHLGRNGGTDAKKDNIYADKGTGDGRKWQMVKIPKITYDAETGKVSVNYTGSGTVHYTTNGDDPTSASTEYSGPFNVNNVTVVKAVAIASEINVSPVITTTIVSAPTIELDPNSFTYDGTAKEPSVTVKYGETTIDPGEYIISYSDNTNAGVVTVTITDNVFGDYCVVGSTTFTISTKSIGSGGDPAAGFSILVTDNHDGTYRSRVKDGSVTLTKDTDYTVSVSGSEGSKTATITGIGNYSGTATVSVRDISYQYVALHASAKGYLKRHNDNGILANDATFRYGNSFENDNGSSIWVLSSDGHLTSDYYYLNVSNERKLYLSVTPITTWETEDISGATKQHVYVTIGSTKYYLCNDSGIELKESPTNYYNACPITLTETSLTSTADNLTVRSPQLISYLRNCYFTQKMSYRFYNDAGTEVKEDNKDRRLFVNLKYKSGGDGKGTKWDVSTNGDILYNKQASGDVEFTATYTLLAADPIVQENHPDGEDKEVKIKVLPKQFTPDTSKSYLIFSVNGGDNYRYPYDDGSLAAGSAVKPDGKGGTGTNSVLTDPDNDGGNKQISWKIEVDEMGFYTFKNVHSNRYLRFDEESYASDEYGYGTLCVGETDIPSGDAANDYKFRLWEANNGDYGKCYYIIPWCRQFAWWKSDGLMNCDYVHPALNISKYTDKTPKVISLHNDLNNSQWCLYKYEAEYRVRNDFTLSGPVSTNETGNNEFKVDDGWYGKYIKESPKNGNGQKGLVISGTYNSTTMMNYIWTVTGLNDYISISGASADDVNGTKSITINSTKTLTINVTSLPVSSVSGTVEVQLRGGAQDGGTTNPFQLSDKKYVVFTIYGGGTVSLTEIESLSKITNINGAYKLTTDVTYSDSEKPVVETFSGILDCDGHTISGLSAPLFTTLTNGTVRNLNLTGVNISQGGSVGAIAGTANGASRIYNVGILGGNVGSTNGNCGGLVGTLDGNSRVINCYSFADVSGGIVGGIVGYNNYASTSNDIRTMVMNCMFYGNITEGSSRYPIYGGELIDNHYTSDSNTGLGNYNFFRQKANTGSLAGYNAALAMEEERLTRYEFFRYLLNSNRELCAFYITGNVADKGLLAKWTMDYTKNSSGVRLYPYPVLKVQDRYESQINRHLVRGSGSSFTADDPKVTEHPYASIDYTTYNDAASARNAMKANRYRGGKMGSLTVTAYCGTDGTKQGASISSCTVTLPITDMDISDHDFGYRKVQLPYYNTLFGKESNYREMVCTGWKITAVNENNTNTFSESTYDFADPADTGKDLFETSGRVFAQGGYYYVPDGVTKITIEAYWGQAVYLADPNYDYTLDVGSNKISGALHPVTVAGTRPTGANTFKGAYQVYTTWKNAADATTNNSNLTVYDNAVVLVGNYHYRGNPYSSVNHPHTLMSVDMDGDEEPDYSFFYQSTAARADICPIRFNFLNFIDLGSAAKPTGSINMANVGVFHPNKHFEITETCLLPTTEFEVNGQNREMVMILNGGSFVQFNTGNVTDKPMSAGYIKYVILGGNAHFKEFQWGVHSDKDFKSPQVPFSVMGGEFDKFYLTGTYKPDATTGVTSTGDAHCYINGGRFGELAGAGQEVLNGSVNFKINNAYITNFYGGGINKAHPVEGDIKVTINNSFVETYCGGAKFGDMASEKVVETKSNGTVFGKYYGAGNGGTSLYRERKQQIENGRTLDQWSSWISDNFGGNEKERGKFVNNKGVGVSYDWEYFSYAGGFDTKRVARFYVSYATLDRAAVNDVSSTLTNCVVFGDYYGGGNLGAVKGNAKSHLTGCTIFGSAYGGGYSASIPAVVIYDATRAREGSNDADRYPSANDNTGLYFVPELPGADKLVYHWEHIDATISDNSGPSVTLSTESKTIYTNERTTGLGAVEGNAIITVDGTTKVHGSVYGGGDESAVLQNTTVNLKGNTEVKGNVFGGGNNAPVSGSATVNIEQ